MMRARIKLIRLMLLAVLALGAYAATTASAAEEGFLPKQATGLVLGGRSTFNAAGLSVVCQKLDTSNITFTSDHHGKGILHWLECKAAGLFAFKSLGATGSEEVLAEVLLLICLDPTRNGKLIDNMGIAAEVVGKLHIEVPAVGALSILTGTMLGAILTTGKAKLWSIEFLGSQGVQDVAECKQGTKVIKDTLTIEENEDGKPAAASENIEGGLLQFKEEVQLEDVGF